MGMSLQERMEKLKEMRNEVVESAARALEQHNAKDVLDWLVVLREIDRRIAEGQIKWRNLRRK